MANQQLLYYRAEIVTDANRFMSPARNLLILLLALILIAEVTLALQWRLLEDSPLLHYIAWLANEHDYVIYRDVFETSMPGTFLVHILIGKLFGYGDLAFRLVDLAWLLGLIASSVILLARINIVSAWAASLGYAIAYIANGPAMAMQRDYLGLLPIVIALIIASGSRYRIDTRAVLVGALFAAAAALKPHLGIGLPVVLIYMAWGGAISRARAPGRLPAPAVRHWIQRGCRIYSGHRFAIALALVCGRAGRVLGNADTLPAIACAYDRRDRNRYPRRTF